MILLAIFLPGTFNALEAISHRISKDPAFYLLAILNGVSAFGCIIAGKVADKFDWFNSMIIISLLSVIFVLGIWIPSKSNTPLIVFATLIGFTSGAFVAMVAAVIGEIADIRQINTRNGTNFFIVSFAALIGNLIAGALIDCDNGGYLYCTYKYSRVSTCLWVRVSSGLRELCRLVLAGREV